MALGDLFYWYHGAVSILEGFRNTYYGLCVGRVIISLKNKHVIGLADVSEVITHNLNFSHISVMKERTAAADYIYAT